jgi:hypothetical protein
MSQRITYLSETASDYSKAITNAETLDELRSVVSDYGDVAADAQTAVAAMSAADFKAWRRGLAKERKGKFAGDEFSERFGDVMMPELMFKVSIVAQKFQVPWGCAYIRLKETGQLEKLVTR